MIVLFIDFSIEFDTSKHEIFLNMLDNLVIRGIYKEWFKSYLTNRCLCANIEKAMSSSLPVKFRLPQGTIFGLVLFVLCSNDIHDLRMKLRILRILCQAPYLSNSQYPKEIYYV